MKKFNEIFTGIANKSNDRKSHSCCGENEDVHQHVNNSQSETIYQCPMKCEGNKTYDKPGRCPVCGMNLAPVNIGSLKH